MERVADGEVSPYLVDVIEPGDQIELRGPIGGYFVWEPSQRSAPPDRRGLRHRPPPGHLASQTHHQATVLYSAQTPERIIFGDELATGPISMPEFT